MLWSFSYFTLVLVIHLASDVGAFKLRRRRSSNQISSDSSNKTGISAYTEIEKACLLTERAFNVDPNAQISFVRENEIMCMKRYGLTEMLTWCQIPRETSNFYEISSNFTAYPTVVSRKSVELVSRCEVYDITIRARYKYGSGEWNTAFLRLFDGVVIAVKDEELLSENQIFTIYPTVTLRRRHTVEFRICNDRMERIECTNATVTIPTLNEQVKEVTAVRIYGN